MSITLGIAAVQVPNYLGGEPPPATRGHTVAGLLTVVSVPPHPHGRNTASTTIFLPDSNKQTVKHILG